MSRPHCRPDPPVADVPVADPPVADPGKPMERDRLLVDEYRRPAGHPDVFACGDAAAVPDLTAPGRYPPMTAQHAWRQGRTAGRHVAASPGAGEREPYEHDDLGFLVDLGGVKAGDPFPQDHPRKD